MGAPKLVKTCFDSAARSDARAAVQPIAAAHVADHAIAAAIYAPTAVRDTAEAERNWQHKHLLELLEHDHVHG
ncbi:MAG TPA: hypothetical protein VLR46_02685 [Candidatus Dormibacteraeota bacterium]|nr:hypothetical protein [Candidatus Dormibacteraeota bacterium]